MTEEKPKIRNVDVEVCGVRIYEVNEVALKRALIEHLNTKCPMA